MDEQTRSTLKKRYAEITDYELTELLSEGKDAYEPEAYDMLLSEARNRGMEEQTEEETIEGKDNAGAVSVPAEKENNIDTFVELVIVVNDKDRDALEEMMNSAGIDYYFQNMNFRGKDWPVALMVDQDKADDTVELLTNKFNPSGSLILW